MRTWQGPGFREGRIMEADITQPPMLRRNFLKLSPKRCIVVITDKKERRKFQAVSTGSAKA